MPELRAISGVGSKGPACFLLRIKGRNLLLDLGQGPDGPDLPDIAGLPPIDAILFSHGHADHTGGLSLWERLGRPPLYATAPTIALTRIAPLASAQKIEDCGAIAGIAVETGPAGHAPGAVWMRIGGADGLTYSGDYSGESLLFPATPPLPARALVLDASYGTADMPLDDQRTAILQAAAQGRATLFPCPAGGRGLDMACTLMDAGLPVSICAAHRDVAATLLTHGDWLTSGATGALQRLLNHAGRLDETAPLSGVMIAAGPNAERGTARALAQRIAQGADGQIIFTGHVAAKTPAAELVAAGHARFLRWNVHPPLTEQRMIVGAVRPEIMLAAFCAPAAITDLRAVTGWPIPEGKEIRW